MHAIAERPELKLQVIAAGTMVLERFGLPVEVVRSDGFNIDGEIYIELEGSTPTTMAKSVGFAVVEFSSEFQRLRPDVVVLIGDRYEAFAAAIAAAYMNLCMVHIQGGEVSGSIDESARHAITKLAQYHFPSTHRSSAYLRRMGEPAEVILGVGCPSSDIARSLDSRLSPDVINAKGSGAIIDITQPFLLAIFHPTTTSYGGEQVQTQELLEALRILEVPTVFLWPNIDAGADHISKAIRIFRDQMAPHWLRTITNVAPEDYLRILRHTACAVGNSSSFVRDASYFGTPVVLIGDRQEGREHDIHVTPTPPAAEEIAAAIRLQLHHGRYKPSVLYGDGFVAERIADQLVHLTPYLQKRLSYVYDDQDPPRVNGHMRAVNLQSNGDAANGTKQRRRSRAHVASAARLG
jgi:UDP-hydrolysing UDP-N-acetyl-D-glucosamine 2-epimerase